MSTKGRTRLTVDLPTALVEQADEFVARGATRSRNRLILQALEAYLRQLEEDLIDAQFAQMAHDKRYIQAQLKIAKEFEHADWEALKLAEGSKPKSKPRLK